jgi:hypothetical protein
MNNIYWKNFVKILRHKYYVFMCGIELDVSLWQLLIHDLSKFSPAEFIPYAKYWEGGARDGQGKVNFDRAFLHHLHHNPHHYEHWILHGTPVPMPDKYIVEMIADWGGAGMAYSGRFDLKEWLEKHWGRVSSQLHPQTREKVSKIVATQYGIIIPY